MTNGPGRTYLHVGCRKTGTSFLQRVIYTGPEALAAQGLEVPLKGRTPHLRLLQSLGVVTDAELPPEEEAALLRRFQRRLSGLAGRPALLSHEDLAAAGPEHVDRLLELLDGFEVHIVITARDLARQIPSEWQQCVKTRMQTTYEDFVDAVARRRGRDATLFWARQDVAAVAARWGRTLPPEQVHIVTVPPSGSAMTLLPERFWSVMGVDPSRLDLPDAGNPSLGAQQAELLRRINVALGDRLSAVRDEYRPVIRLFVGQVLNRQEGKPLGLPRHYAEWCYATSVQLVEELRSRGYGVVGHLTDLLPPDSEVSAADKEDGGLAVDDAEVAEAAVEALASLLDQQHRDRQLPDRTP